jgi:antitoxin component YwqK of YwqJK toxin-antitoxin module
MKKKSLAYGLLSFIILTSCKVKQQYSRPEFKDRYTNQMLQSEQPLVQAYHILETRRKDGKYIRRIFFPETKQITQYFEYSDRTFTTLDGITKEWYDNGQLWKEGEYLNGKLDGLYKSYHYDNGSLQSEGKYTQGKIEGIWNYFDTEGRITSKSTFKNGELEKTVMFDKLGNQTEQMLDSLTFIEKPEFEGGEKGLLNYLSTKVRYPSLAREYDIEGNAIVRFVVGKDGFAKDVIVLRGLCNDISIHLNNLVSTMPAWKPGRNKGKPVNVTYTLPVRFKLE